MEIISMPRRFPVGKWHNHGSAIRTPIRMEDNGYLYPFFIATDAWQWLDEWELDDKGFYPSAPTGKKVKDTADGLHFSSCDWTQGCLRIATEAELRWLVAKRIGW